MKDINAAQACELLKDQGKMFAPIYKVWMRLSENFIWEPVGERLTQCQEMKLLIRDSSLNYFSLFSQSFPPYCTERNSLGQWAQKCKLWKRKKIWHKKVSLTHSENHLAVASLVHPSIFWSRLPWFVQQTFMSASWEPGPVPGSGDTRHGPWRATLHWGFRPGAGTEHHMAIMKGSPFLLHREGSNILAGPRRLRRTPWRTKDILNSDWLQSTLEQHRLRRLLARERQVKTIITE